MSNISYWNQTGEKSHYPRLITAYRQTCYHRGGITGVTCAYCLAEKA